MKHLFAKYGIYSVTDLQRHYEGHSREGGKHWFDKGTMSFFKCKLDGQVYCDDTRFYFVSSEKGPDNVRAYSVRTYDPVSGQLDTLEGTEFQGFKTNQQAKTFIRKMPGIII